MLGRMRPAGLLSGRFRPGESCPGRTKVRRRGSKRAATDLESLTYNWHPSWSCRGHDGTDTLSPLARVGVRWRAPDGSKFLEQAGARFLQQDQSSEVRALGAGTQRLAYSPVSANWIEPWRRPSLVRSAVRPGCIWSAAAAGSCTTSAETARKSGPRSALRPARSSAGPRPRSIRCPRRRVKSC